MKWTKTFISEHTQEVHFKIISFKIKTEKEDFLEENSNIRKPKNHEKPHCTFILFQKGK